MPSRLAICLYEEQINSFDLSSLFVGDIPSKVELKFKNDNIQLFIKEANSNTPEWVEIVENFGKISGKEIKTSTSGAILLLKIKDRIVACCFGNTVANINKENIVPDFGLGAAFSRIEKKDIKGIETIFLSNNPIVNNRTSANPTSKDSFNIDNYLENITEISGRFLTKTKTVTIKGKAFFSIPSPQDLNGIIQLSESLISDYIISTNNEDYKRLTSIKKVKEKKLITHLNEELCKNIRNKSDEISLVDFDSYAEIDSYTFSPKGKRYDTITITDFYSEYKTGTPISINYLRDKRITIYRDSQALDHWSVYKCLFHEIKINIGTYMLYKGSWFQIQNRYLNDLRNFIKDYEIDSTTINLPKWDGIQNEGPYNENTAKVINGQCWDKVFYTHPSYTYQIEFCDLLTEDYIIHVKKYGSSSLSSHLLLQATVSAELMHADPLILKWISITSKKIFNKNLILNSKNKLKNENIGYLLVLLSNSKRKLSESLPFFSLVSFNLIIKKISQYFPIKICKA